MSQPATASPTDATPLDAGTVYKRTAMFTFLCGAVLHSTSLVLGPDRFVHEVFSPWIEVVFSALLIFGAIAGWKAWRRFTGSRFMRVFYGFSLVFITISIPIHLRSVVLWSTAWVHAFPRWYSEVEVPLFLAMIWGASRLRFVSQEGRHGN